MVLKMLRERKCRKIEREVIDESIDQAIAEIKQAAYNMKMKLRNGGGEAIIEAFHGLSEG